ncbi:hypothetical protein TcCL_ESM03533 [Trypanosoma cruzi]|nr:hypothetical protein TcCL_ESM03533 [Trypanosoma cruzi]
MDPDSFVSFSCAATTSWRHSRTHTTRATAKRLRRVADMVSLRIIAMVAFADLACVFFRSPESASKQEKRGGVRCRHTQDPVTERAQHNKTQAHTGKRSNTAQNRQGHRCTSAFVPHRVAAVRIPPPTARPKKQFVFT